MAEIDELDELAASVGTVKVEVAVPEAPPAKLRLVPLLPVSQAALNETDTESAPFPVFVTVY